MKWKSVSAMNMQRVSSSILSILCLLFIILLFLSYTNRRFNILKFLERVCDFLLDPFSMRSGKAGGGSSNAIKNQLFGGAGGELARFRYSLHHRYNMADSRLHPRGGQEVRDSSGAGKIVEVIEAEAEFEVSLDHLRLLDMPPMQFISGGGGGGGGALGDAEQQPPPPWRVTFVTAMSANHYRESQDAIASVQKLRYAHKIVVYDLGLEQEQVAELRSMCMVLYRKFDFSLFPDYVKDLTQYRWKALILQSTLSEFGVVFWMDASIRFSYSLPRYWSKVLQQGARTGVVLFERVDRVPAAASTLDANLIRYFPTDLSQYSGVTAGVTAALYLNTKEVYNNVIKWLVLCALQDDCMAPDRAPGDTTRGATCRYGAPPGGDTSAGASPCYSQYQAASNILLANNFNYNLNDYISRYEILTVERTVTNYYKVKMCIIE